MAFLLNQHSTKDRMISIEKNNRLGMPGRIKRQIRKISVMGMIVL
jgi:hypothetical protein